MAGADPFLVEGCVMAALPNGTFRVRLPNGHCLTGFVAGRARRAFRGGTPGDTVKLRLTPYDLSKGRIVVENETI
jgi:translation initiation factor IF-1